MTKPMLASDWDEKKVKFPIFMQPKIDGVRGMNLGHGMTGRSLKVHKNIFTTHFFSQGAFIGMDGELAAERDTHPSLCRLTTSAVGTILGEPFVMWHVFDYLMPSTIHLPYGERYDALCLKLRSLQAEHPGLALRVRIVPTIFVRNIEELERQDKLWLDAGYEGSILRDPQGKYKQGRSTVKEGGLLRIKRFVEEEAVVDKIVEGQQNLNEALVNELGHTERSTHQANMVPNGMVGAMECTDVKTGKPITVSAGCMTHDERVKYFTHPELLLKQTIKYKTFLKGVKDLPRFPTFQSIKIESDIG